MATESRRCACGSMNKPFRTDEAEETTTLFYSCDNCQKRAGNVVLDENGDLVESFGDYFH